MNLRTAIAGALQISKRALGLGGRKPTDDPNTKGSIRLHQLFGAGTKYRTAIEAAAAMHHPVLARCLLKLASSVQTVDWYADRLGAAKPKGEVRPYTTAEEKAIGTVLQNPADTFGAQHLRFWMTLQLATAGVAFFAVGRTSTGAPNAIYPLMYDRVAPVFSGRNVITDWEFSSGDKKIVFPTRQTALARDDAAKGSFPQYVERVFVPGMRYAENPCDYASPLRSLGLPAQIVDLLMQRAVDTASGHPNSRYVVTADQLLTRQQEDELRDAIDDRGAGGDRSGEVLMLSGLNAKVTKLDNDLTDIHSKMPLDDMARMIAGAFGIPIALLGLGAADGAKFASNYSESRTSFWEDTVIPCYLTPIAEGLSRAIGSDKVRVRFDLDTIPALQLAKAARAVTLSGVTFLSDDEKRELIGFEPRQGAPAAATGNSAPTLQVVS